MGLYQKREVQFIPASPEAVWDFMSSPKNLKKITPDYMGFDITTPYVPEKMYEGLIISYKVSPVLGIKMTWVTEITHVKDRSYFVDEQRYGPYVMWHHEHIIREVEGGTEMTDIISYIPPFGILGDIAHGLFIKKQLKEIFDYRRKAVEEFFKP